MPPFDLKEIFLSIEKTLPSIKDPIACFDADGTLWRKDIDIHFLNYQIQNNLLKNKTRVEKAQKIYSVDQAQACTLMAQRNEGMALQDLQKQSQESFKQSSLDVFSFQKELISFLKKNSVKVYVITASPQWIVQEAVQFYQLEVDFVIGIKNKIENNILTSEVELPVSVGKGKVDAFLKHSPNKQPFFAAGNTLSDLPLLEFSSRIKLAISSCPQNEVNYQSERKLLKIAQENSWFFQDLTPS